MGDRTKVLRRTVIGGGLSAAGTFIGATTRADDLPWTLPPLQTVVIGGRPIAHFERGVGSPVVLLHGMSGSAAFEWGRVIRPLSERHRVIAPYQTGFGPSAQPDVAYDSGVFVDFLADFMRALGVHSPTLVGESFGGWVAAYYACAQSERRGPDALPPIARLAVVDGPVGIRSTDQGQLDAESVNDPAVRAQVHDFFASQRQFDNTMVRMRATQSVPRDMVAAERLGRTRLPILVIWGEQDRLLNVTLGKRLAAEVPGARLAVIPNCGHIPSVEQPAAFLHELARFSAA